MTAMADRIVLIANPGSRQGVTRARLAERHLRDRGIDIAVRYTDAPGHGVDLAREAAEEGSRVVGAVGGDGTIGEVLSGLVDGPPDVAMGIIPAGTGNDTAKGLRLPVHDVRAAAEILASRPPRLLDLLDVNGRPSLGFAVIGFAADVGVSVNRWKSGPWRWASQILRSQTYGVVVAWHLLRGARPLACRMTGRAADGSDYRFDGDVLTILVGNQPGVGGVFLPCPAAVGDDGVFDVCFVTSTRPDGRPLSFAEKVRTLRGAIRGEHIGMPWVEYFQSASPLHLEFTAAAPVLADGDLRAHSRTVALRVRPRALPVVC
ncbi:MAG: hypothetical protein GX134_07840 [candidate division WS1 bacterium]|nr:hypothetical protein [candidate division WS1 bacterium]